MKLYVWFGISLFLLTTTCAVQPVYIYDGKYTTFLPDTKPPRNSNTPNDTQALYQDPDSSISFATQPAGATEREPLIPTAPTVQSESQSTTENNDLQKPPTAPPSLQAPLSSPLTQDNTDTSDLVLQNAPIVNPQSLYANASPSTQNQIQRAVAMGNSGNWKSAYLLLASYDQNNEDPYILAAKIELALKGEVRTNNHRAFAFVDLLPNQTLDSVRKDQKQYELYSFDPPLAAEYQARRAIEVPSILNKNLGDYYAEVYRRFSGKWRIPDAEITQKIIYNYTKSYNSGVYDALSLSRFGTALARMGRINDFNIIFRRALALEPSNPKVHYDYGVALLSLSEFKQAINMFDSSITNYGSNPLRINPIAMAARAATESGDTAKAENYFVMAEREFPNSGTGGLLRHLIAVESGNKPLADAAADKLVAEYGNSPNLVRALASTYFSTGKTQDGRDFLLRNARAYSDDVVSGTLYFYLAVLYSQSTLSAENKKSGLLALEQAEVRLKRVYNPDDEVFTTIASIRNILQS